MSKDEPTYYDRLRSSTAVQSLASEQEIWRAVSTYESADLRYPFYFTDSSTQKIRELDLYAEYHFDSGIQNGTLNVVFLVECKSLSGFHLVLSKVQSRWPSSGSVLGHVFSRRHYDFQEDVLRALEATGYAYPIPLMRKRLEEITYSRQVTEEAGAKSSSYLPNAVESTSFRETNIGVDRELDNSVVWKSARALQDGRNAVLARSAIYARNAILPLRPSEQLISLDRLEESFRQDIGSDTLVYPIISVGAPIHVFENNTLHEADHVRLRIEVDDMGSFWVDVIRHSKFAECFAKILNHFQEEFPQSTDED